MREGGLIGKNMIIRHLAIKIKVRLCRSLILWSSQRLRPISKTAFPATSKAFAFLPILVVMAVIALAGTGYVAYETVKTPNSGVSLENESGVSSSAEGVNGQASKLPSSDPYIDLDMNEDNTNTNANLDYPIKSSDDSAGMVSNDSPTSSVKMNLKSVSPSDGMGVSQYVPTSGNAYVGPTLPKKCKDNQTLKYEKLSKEWVCKNNETEGPNDTVGPTYVAGSGINIQDTTISVSDTYDDNFLTTTSSFGGDVSGTYNNIAVTDNSHAHDTTTISGLDITSDTNLAGDTEIVLTSGTPNDSLSIASSITRDSEWNTVAKIETATSANILTSTENISLLTNDSGYITASSSSALTNKTGNISMWTNNTGFITASSSDNLTNKTYNGLTLTSSTDGFTLTGGTTPRTLTITGADASLSGTHSGSSSGTNTGDNATNSQYSSLITNATHTGDATGSSALTVVAINGTNLSSLGTGILKNTTGTGTPSIATSGDFPTLNQNTTGNAATATNLTGLTATISNLNTVTGSLGTAAFTPSTDYATSAQGNLATNALPQASFTDSAVTAKLLTGFTSGSGTITATDTILSSIQKLDGNIALKAPLNSPTFTGTVSGITAMMVGLGNVTNESKTTMFASPTFTGIVSGITSTMVGLGNVPNLSFSGSNTGDQTITLTGDVSGSGIGSFTTTVADNSHAHDTTTISGLDITSDTNLAGDTEIVLTSGTPNDSLSIASSITRDSEWNTVAKIEAATGENIITSGENATDHTQNTDTGTTSQTFQTDSGNSGPKLKNNTGTLEVRNSADNAYSNFKVQDLDAEGSLYSGSGNVQLTDTTGKIQALSSTYFASLSGSNLTALNASNLSTGTVPSAQISGSYTGITGLGTITTGTWNGTAISATKGGTGLTTISEGKILYASATDTIGPLSLDTTLEIVAGTMGVIENNILLSLLGGTLTSTQLPTGGAWTLSSNLNIDANTLVVDQANNRIGIGTTNPATDLDVNGTIKTKSLLLTNETSAPLQEEGKVYYDANDKQFKLYNSQNGAYTDLSQDPHIAPSYCPDGYVPVPGDVRYGTGQGFCVAKYEMKCALSASSTVGLTTPDTGYHTYNNSATACTTDRAPQSIASGYPIANITQTTAQTYCSNLGTGYHLITNNEWMTIARNIEKTASNWTGGSVGSGGIWRGHSDNSPATALEAYSDDTDPYYGTGNTAPSIEKRIFTLTNGKILWDLSGNVWEWNNDTIRRKDECHTTDRSNGWGWSELTTLDNYGSLSYAQVRPSKTTWNSGQNMGQIYTYSPSSDTDNTPYAFFRGGIWAFGGGAGLFALL